MDSIDLCETLDWHTAKNGKNLYGWSTAFNNRVKYRLAHTADGDVARKNYDGLTSANIGNQFFLPLFLRFLELPAAAAVPITAVFGAVL